MEVTTLTTVGKTATSYDPWDNNCRQEHVSCVTAHFADQAATTTMKPLPTSIMHLDEPTTIEFLYSCRAGLPKMWPWQDMWPVIINTGQE